MDYRKTSGGAINRQNLINNFVRNPRKEKMQMSMKKSLLLLGFVTLAAVILVACGGKPTEVPTTAPAATQAPTVAAPTEAPMTIPNLDVFKTSGHANDKAEAFHHWDDATAN